MKVKFQLLDSELAIPTKSHIGDAGVDLQARFGIVLEPGERAAVATGIAVAIPDGYAGFVLPRSGHASRAGVGIVNGPGLVDSGYRGEVAVLLINHGSESVSFARGDRIAQLVVMAVPEFEFVQVDNLDRSSRGEGGFGSTGV